MSARTAGEMKPWDMTTPVERDGAVSLVFNFDDGAEVWTAIGVTAAQVAELSVDHAYDLVARVGVLRYSNRTSRDG